MYTAPRRTRGAAPTSAGIEDIGMLSLAEVRSRLERNQRVLGTALFSTSPTSPSLLSTSPTSQTSALGNGSPFKTSITDGDPLREKLLAARQALLAREQELLLENGMNGMQVGQAGAQVAESSANARRRASGGMGTGNGQYQSGKARAIESIQAGEGKTQSSGIIIPIDQALALSERDYMNAAAERMSTLTFENPSPASSLSKFRRRYDPNDEIARAEAAARMKAFMGYRSNRDGGDDDEMLEDWGDEGEYDGEEDKFTLGPQGREPHMKERGTGEEVDEQGEDDEGWAEGNDEYLDRVR